MNDFPPPTNRGGKVTFVPRTQLWGPRGAGGLYAFSMNKRAPEAPLGSTHLDRPHQVPDPWGRFLGGFLVEAMKG